MSKRKTPIKKAPDRRRIAITATIALIVAVGAFFGIRALRGDNPENLAAAAQPVTAPTIGSCWSVDENTADEALPWPGSPVDCAREHTVEIYHVGRVDAALVVRAAKARGDENILQNNLMYAQARRACSLFASPYLKAPTFRTSRLRVVASWIVPQNTGYFACGLAVVADPAGKHFVPRTASLSGAGQQLGIDCVEKVAGGEQRYVGCDAPHDGEFVGTYTLTPPDAPFSADGVRDAATRGCADLAVKFIGTARTDVYAAHVGPATASEWLGSDQTFACYAMVSSGKLRGSIKGLAGGPLPRP